MLQQVYRNNTISCMRVFEWHKRFKEGREDDFGAGGLQYAGMRLTSSEKRMWCVVIVGSQFE